MAETVLVPQLGNTVESVILLEWRKNEGDTIRTGDILCEVETDKTTMEVEATAGGTILKRLGEPGDELAVKSPLVVVGEPGEPIPDTQVSPVTSSPSKETVDKSGTSEEHPGTERIPDRETPLDRDIPPHRESSARQGVSPRARMRATAADVNQQELKDLTGSGPAGRILERDVEELLRGDSRVPPTATAAVKDELTASADHSGAGNRPEPVTEIKVRGIRKVIAERMRFSLASTAQFTLHGSADARALQALRKRFKESGEDLQLHQVSINDMVMYAVARTLPEFPKMNAHFDGTVIRRYARVDLGFAVDTERGLMVPTVPAADSLSLGEMSRRVKELARRCTEGNAAPDDLAAGTFTVSNLGSYGVEYFTPVLNPPQVAILGINTIQLKPVFGPDGLVEHVPHIGLSLTVDHQAVDGAPAARFLQKLSARIAGIDLLLAL